MNKMTFNLWIAMNSRIKYIPNKLYYTINSQVLGLNETFIYKQKQDWTPKYSIIHDKYTLEPVDENSKISNAQLFVNPLDNNVELLRLNYKDNHEINFFDKNGLYNTTSCFIYNGHEQLIDLIFF
jgi:hypothetical protein